MKFGEKCKELRSQKGMTQIDVAQQVGVGRRTYIDYENSGVHPKSVKYTLSLRSCSVAM